MTPTTKVVDHLYYLTGRPVGKGLEAPLADANEIRIGAYTMLVTKTLQLPSAQTLLRADAADLGRSSRNGCV